jgi:2,5-diketo-D-gluconate reductase A
MIDTAASYGNEREVGAAIGASGVDRSELFVQTKVWVSNNSYDGALHAFDVSTRKLGLDRVDLYLLHQPLPHDFDATVDAYRALERLLDEGRIRAIGVSNFSPAHLETVLPRLSVVPAVNQVEVHPYYNQPALRAVRARLGIATQALRSRSTGARRYGVYSSASAMGSLQEYWPQYLTLLPPAKRTCPVGSTAAAADA